MSRPERILVDYDWTLFDSTEFFADLWAEISSYSGRDVDQVAIDGNNMHADPVLGGYFLNKHMGLYELDPEHVWEWIRESLHEKEYLYHDSVEFMHILQEAGFRPEVLTFGVEAYQNSKVYPYLGRLSLNEVSPVECTAIFEPKGRFIGRNFGGEKGVLVDDVPGQDLPRDFTEIHLDRKRGLSSPAEETGIFVVSSLHQAYEVIRQVHP